MYDLYGNLIERDAFINFDSLRSHLKIKLSSLALIYASKKRIECVDYFRYYKMIIYELKSFDVFLKLLEENIIINLHALGLGNSFLDMTPKTQTTKEKIDK